MTKKQKSAGDNLPGRIGIEVSLVDWSFPTIQFQPLFPKSLLEDMAKIGSAWARMTEQIAAAAAPLADTLAALSFDLRRADRIEESGWLPHYTTPFDLISDETPVEKIGEIVGAYYHENWDVAHAAFVKRLETCEVDDEAKATFMDALAAHKYGLFRSVPRTLFPEIERVASVELYNGSRTYPRKGKNGKGGGGIASLPDFAATVGELPVGRVLTTDYGLSLYLKLREHLYQPVLGQDGLARAVGDPVPNRHASLHGIVVYNTMQTSVNALIMTDFIFHAIGQIKCISEGADRR